MTKEELRARIKALVKDAYQDADKIENDAAEYDELTKFPELKLIIVDLLTPQFKEFLESIDWVAPRPTTFRINLLNGQNFLLIYTDRSWVAQVEGKKYYLLNLDEEERCAQSIARILAYGEFVTQGGEGDFGGEGGDFGGGSDFGGGGGGSASGPFSAGDTGIGNEPADDTDTEEV